ncbi:MAG: nuclear transport factor 2 family protein [Cyclobacteriaceae bacterium]
MKSYYKVLRLFIGTMFLTFSILASAQSSDKANIEKVIENYIIGWRTGDVDLLKETFDLDAGVILWINKKGETEKLNSMTLLDLAERVKIHEDYGVDFKIQNIDIIDSQLAMAKVKIPLPSKESYYIDYLQLQKINDNWRIVLKSYVYFPKR